MFVIETEDLSYYYSEGVSFETLGVDHINISIEENKIIGIIGHTGSGKSTFAQLLNGLIKPTTGKILLKGKNLWEDFSNIRDVHFKVGLTFQYPENQLFSETVYNDISFGPSNQGLNKHEIEQRVLMAMDFVGLDYNLLDRSPFDLSGGEKRRVAIAGVIAMNPEVLILDEPTAGLDTLAKEELLSSICRYHQQTHNVIIFISHVMEDIARICDKTIVFNKGKVVKFNETKKIFNDLETINKLGLDVPQITRIMREIYKKTGHENKCIINVEEAVDEIVNIFKNNRIKLPNRGE